MVPRSLKITTSASVGIPPQRSSSPSYSIISRQMVPDDSITEAVVRNMQTLIAATSEAFDSMTSMANDIPDLSAVESSALGASDADVLIAGGVVFLAAAGLLSIQDTEMDAEAERLGTSNASQSTRGVILEGPKEKRLAALKDDRDSIQDDLTKEKDAVYEAYVEGDDSLLRKSLSKLVGMVRSTRVRLHQAEGRLQEVAEELRDMEDKYELEQNSLKRKEFELTKTRSSLESTEMKLNATSASLAELEEERKSLRKLARAAWKLSKERVQKRVKGRRARRESDEGLERSES
eukprot:scaffold24105_cov127-Cylindrotheca_fusiformis.AAC.2